MANPWDQDEIVSGNPWDADEVVAPAKPAAKPKASKPARSGAQQLGHDLSYGARSILENAGGAVDFFTEPLHRGFEAVGLPQHRFRDLGRMGADAVGLDQPENAGERISSDVTGALAGLSPMGLARQIPQAAGPVMQGVKTFFGAQPGTQAAGAITGATAAGATREAGGSDGQQMTAGIVGALLPGAGAYGAAGTARRAMRGDGGNVYSPGELAAMGYQKGGVAENALAELIAFRRAGINNPTVGQVGQTRLARATESGLSQFPGSAGVMASHAQGQIDDATRTLDGITGGAGPTTAGRAIEQGSQEFGNRMQSVGARVYAPVHAAMDGQPVQIDNTLSALRRSTNPVPSTSATSAQLGNKKLGNVLDALLADSRHAPTFPGVTPQRSIPFEGLKAQRSEIGEMIGDAHKRDVGASTKQLERAYGAMSADMEAGARSVGPQAESALARANRVNAQGMQRQGVLRDAVKAGAPEDIYRRAIAGLRDGGTELGVLMKALKPDQRSEVSRAVIRQLGRVTKGQQDAEGGTFSAVTFKNNWADLSPEAKSALFDHLPPAQRRQLQAMADVGRNVQEGSAVFANPAGTSGKSVLYSLITGGPGLAAATGSILPILGAAAAPVGANGLARLMTNPASVRFATQKTRKPYGIYAPAAAIESQRNKRATP